MNIKELRESMNSIPSDFDEYEVIFVEANLTAENKISSRIISLESIAVNYATAQFMIGNKESINNLIDLSNTLNDGN